jgi:hypothetical protein
MGPFSKIRGEEIGRHAREKIGTFVNNIRQLIRIVGAANDEVFASLHPVGASLENGGPG